MTFLERVISLDERRAKDVIEMAMGKWGTGWVLEVIANVFNEIVDTDSYDCCEKVNAATRVYLLRALKDSLFKTEKPLD